MSAALATLLIGGFVVLMLGLMLNAHDRKRGAAPPDDER